MRCPTCGKDIGAMVVCHQCLDRTVKKLGEQVAALRDTLAALERVMPDPKEGP